MGYVMNMKKIIIHFVLLLSLAGCSATFRSEIVRFHDLTPPNGAKITVQPGEGLVDGPEFRQYADMIIAKLAQQGYQAAGEEEPDLIVQVSYGVLKHETRNPIFHWRTSYYYNRGFGYYPYSYYYPYYYGSYWDFPADYYFPEKNDRMLEVIIKKPDETAVFEGRAVSVGRTSQLVKVMPYMVEALFQGFPGESGVVSYVSVSEEDLLNAQ